MDTSERDVEGTPLRLETVDWRGGCGRCAFGWVLAVTADGDPIEVACDCYQTPASAPDNLLPETALVA